jgi:hypothetical protein
MKVLFSRKIVVFITLVVTIMPIIALPTMIDGISYVKVFVALTCVMPFIPFMLKKIFETKDRIVIWILTLSPLLIAVFSVFLIQGDYRGVFGAPGRNNGTLSILLYLCFTIFGIYVYIKNSISIILHGLVVSSSLTCLIANLHLISPGLNLFPSLDFSSDQFRDNVDNIAPLVSMALTASLILYWKSKNIVYLILQIPTVYFVIRWQLLQPLVTLIPSIFLIVLREKFTKSKLFTLTPLLILAGYISSIKVLPSTPLVNDSSVRERLEMVTYLKEMSNHLSLLPIHIDALSDFSSSFVALTPRAYLDDFHNVYLQLIFSFGLIFGLAIIALLIAPFLLSAHKFDKTEFIFPIYFNFFVSLFFAIASPNFMYFGFIFIGYLLAGTLSNRGVQLQSIKGRVGIYSTLYLAVVLALALQMHDFAKRIDISNTSRAYSSEFSNEKYFESLVDKVSGIQDAEYKLQVARNFYAIGKCAYGNLVFEQLLTINAREVRNVQLAGLKRACEPM